MSIVNPPADWCKAPQGREKVWLGFALAWCLVMTIMMPYWHFAGKQTSSGEAYTVTPKDFNARVEEFVKAHHVGDMEQAIPRSNPITLPVAEPTPGGDAYLIGRNWQWYPILKLKKDAEYRLHISSWDYQHGFSIQGEQGMNMNFHVVPGYDHVLTITPTRAGKYTIICNEFCGGGHADMRGTIIVE